LQAFANPLAVACAMFFTYAEAQAEGSALQLTSGSVFGTLHPISEVMLVG
jgi:hypothetical protein